MEGPQRHRGWTILSVVAACFAAGVVVNVIRAVFAHEYLFVLPAGISLLFWYWIGMGAHRRAVARAPHNSVRG